ncbi:MAG: insulinase family protein [Frankiaceae bacterium]|jgi:predicted Zn-dependent peptidase|nr:insulinase family protein [Frankiaceae bacterium]
MKAVETATTMRRTTVPGGLRIVTEAMPGARSAAVGVWVDVGSRDESPRLAGASHFLEHLLFKGTGTRTGLEIARAMDAVGGEFNAFTTKEATCYHATVRDSDLPLAIELVSDIVLDAAIAAPDVAVERTVVLEEIAMRDDDPADLVHDEFSSALLGDTPLGRPVLGTVESINALTRTQIVGYYRRRYRPPRMVVAVAGNVAHRDVVRQVRAAFGGALDDGASPESPRAGAPIARLDPARAVHVTADDTEQANIVLGMHGLDRGDERRFALAVLSAALGGGMSSRLFQEIREKRGLAYSTYSFVAHHAGGGSFGLYAGCHPDKAEQVLEIMRAQLADVAAGGLSGEEVERAKGQLRGGTVLGLEDSTSRMSRIGKAELSFGSVLTVDKLLARFDRVRPAQVRALAAELLARPRCLAVVGPFDADAFGSAA